MRIKNEEDRLDRLEKWVKENTCTVKASISVVNKKNISTEYHDILCQTLVNTVLHDIIEKNMCIFDITDKKYSTEITAIKVNPKIKGIDGEN